jgi:hypothetical protein
MWAIAAFSVLLCVVASAQTPAPFPDVPLSKIGGVYNIGCVTPSDTDLVDVCFVRTDQVTGVVELGCVAGPEPETEFRMDVSVQQTPFEDAEIRCYVTDDDLNASLYSDNAGIIDFTPPGKGRVK